MKKKVSLITRHAIVNYGSFLQTLATQNILEELGLEVDVIDYVRDDENYKNVTDLLLNKSKKWNKNMLTKTIYRAVQWPDHYLCGIAFEQKRKELLNMTQRYTSLDQLKKELLLADYYCTGSDQVWGEIGFEKYDGAYFYDFPRKEGSKLVAFAASFGKSQYEEYIMDEYKRLLKPYDHITVREKTALELVNQSGKEAQVILDPTLVFGKERWMKYLPTIKSKKYVLLYQLNANKEMDDYAVQFAQKANLKLIRISVELHNGLRSGKFKWCLSPFEFMAYVNGAEYMITDSFHGTAFAIMFNTQFIEVLPEEKKTRNKNILQMFGLEDRILENKSDYAFISKKIDYDLVNRKLKVEQEKSMNILKEIFEV